MANFEIQDYAYDFDLYDNSCTKLESICDEDAQVVQVINSICRNSHCDCPIKHVGRACNYPTLVPFFYQTVSFCRTVVCTVEVSRGVVMSARIKIRGSRNKSLHSYFLPVRMRPSLSSFQTTNQRTPFGVVLTIYPSGNELFHSQTDEKLEGRPDFEIEFLKQRAEGRVTGYLWALEDHADPARVEHPSLK